MQTWPNPLKTLTKTLCNENFEDPVKQGSAHSQTLENVSSTLKIWIRACLSAPGQGGLFKDAPVYITKELHFEGFSFCHPSPISHASIITRQGTKSDNKIGSQTSTVTLHMTSLWIKKDISL